MNRFSSIFLTAALLVSGAANSGDLSLFDRAAALALSVATTSAEKGVELDAEKRAKANPGQAESILRNSKAVQGGLQGVGDKLFDAATGTDSKHHNNNIKGSYRHTLPSQHRSKTRISERNIKPPYKPEIQEVEVGIFDDMKKKGVIGGDTEIHHIPSKRWLELNGFDPKKAVAVRMATNSHKATQTNGPINKKIVLDEKDHSFKDVVVRDIKDFKDIYLAAGADPEMVKSKVVEIIALTNTVYSDILKKPRPRTK